jgi:hypothetical protein
MIQDAGEEIDRQEKAEKKGKKAFALSSKSSKDGMGDVTHGGAVPSKPIAELYPNTTVMVRSLRPYLGALQRR